MSRRSRKRLTILVVQQTPTDRKRLMEVLADDKAEVLGASGGDDGLDALHERQPDILVTDIVFRDMDGIAFMEKAREAVQGIKIIVVFGEFNPQDLVRAVESGVEAFIRLPLDETKLREAVMQCARDIVLARRMAQVDYSLHNLLDFFPAPAVLIDGVDVTYMNRPLTSFFGYQAYDKLGELDSGIEDFILKINGIDYNGQPGEWVDLIVNDPVDRDHVLHMENPRNPEGRPTVFTVTFNQFPGSDMRLFTFHDVSGLEDEKVYLEGEASTDPLTGTLNRRSFLVQLSQTVAVGRTFGLIMFDIDHFKSVNDTYGHDVGDSVLKEIAQVVRNNIRVQDMLARWGGEEFMVLSPGAGPKLMARVAERLRERIAGFQFTGVPRQVTSSFGMVVYELGEQEEVLLKRADQALYRAKETGRNKVVKG
ncbi:GGDEF domain-containing response regulator [Pseudodesulfovibrio sediminis]|uniref:diguanylate cyclase n=1 Tax=Pseudodesulfovibrio sediminis TaxID=2810563 RepID=A0ABM7P7T2_9BACT|nr:diguanylate cyclase [Pseudodesulfovibrio sediminis]BCS89044.1 GGDEF domain-containing protein [Pseudodesulfovibrio sediminis]